LDGFQFIKGDICHPEDFPDIKIDAIIHLGKSILMKYSSQRERNKEVTLYVLLLGQHSDFKT
jgi:threonine dehydratase